MLINSLVQYLLTSSVYYWVQNPDSRYDGMSTWVLLIYFITIGVLVLVVYLKPEAETPETYKTT